MNVFEDSEPASHSGGEHPRTALLVVDVQPTFCEHGELPVAGGTAVAQAIGGWLPGARSRYEVVATSQDWHIAPGAHFSVNPDFRDSWPPHGLADTPNAALHPAISHLCADPAVVTVRKGQYAAAYSAFDGTTADGQTLLTVLRGRGIAAVHVIGIAASHCVAETALDAAGAGLDTTILTDLTVGVSPELTGAAYRRVSAAGVHLRRSDEISDGTASGSIR
jgi:nicotinamidase/pyrazinamidase